MSLFRDFFDVSIIELVAHCDVVVHVVPLGRDDPKSVLFAGVWSSGKDIDVLFAFEYIKSEAPCETLRELVVIDFSHNVPLGRAAVGLNFVSRGSAGRRLP